MNNNKPIRAERQTVRFFDGLEVDGYRMPNGEFRVSLVGASTTIGFSKGWLSQVMNRVGGDALKELQGLGFSQEKLEVCTQTKRGNFIESDTISLDDFNSCIIYGTQQKKKQSVALNKAFGRLSLLDFFRDAFGEPPLSIEEKRKLFYETYAASISPEHWREMDRYEILALALPGDEPQLRDGKWNR